jgi:hypothetical protein
MADRRIQPQQQTRFAAIAACLLVTTLSVSAPALAASDKLIPCPNTVLTEDLEVQALVTRLVNNDIPSPTSSILAPLAEAAIREAFRESDSSQESARADLTKATAVPPMAGTESSPVESSNDEGNDENAGPVPAMNTRLPGVSDEVLSRYKKQMYRRDI